MAPPRPASSGLHFDPVRGTTTSVSSHKTTAPSSSSSSARNPSATSPAVSMSAITSILSPAESSPVPRPRTVPPPMSTSAVPSPSQSSIPSSRTTSSRPSGSGFSIANLIDPPETAPPVSRHSDNRSRSSSNLDPHDNTVHHYPPSSVVSPALVQPAPAISTDRRSYNHDEIQPPPHTSDQAQPSNHNSALSTEQFFQLYAPSAYREQPRIPLRGVVDPGTLAFAYEEARLRKKRKSAATKEKVPTAKKRQSEPSPVPDIALAPAPATDPLPPPVKVTKPRQRKAPQKSSSRKSTSSARDPDEKTILESDVDISMADVTAQSVDNSILPADHSHITLSDAPVAVSATATKPAAKPSKRAPKSKKSSVPVTDAGEPSKSTILPEVSQENKSQNLVQNGRSSRLAPPDNADFISATSTLAPAEPKPEKKRRKPKAGPVVEESVLSDSAMDVDSPANLDPDTIEIPPAALLGALLPAPLQPIPTFGTDELAAPHHPSTSPAPGPANVAAPTVAKSHSNVASKASSHTSTVTPPGNPKATSKRGHDLPSTIALLPGMALPPSDSDHQGINIWLTFPLKGQNNVTLNFAREVEKKYGLGALNPRAAAHNLRRKAIWKMGEELERQERARKNGGGDDDSADDIQSVDLNSDDDRGSDADPMDLDLDPRRRAGSPTHSSEELAKLEEMNLDPEKWKFAKNGRLVRRRKRKQEEYDRNDDFVDDTEMAWDEQARMAQDGFFVYSGPLKLDNAGSTTNGRSDGTKSSRPSRAKGKVKSATNGDDPAGTSAPKAPRSRAKAGANAAAGGTTTTTRKRATKADKNQAAATATSSKAGASSAAGSIAPLNGLPAATAV